MIASSNIMARNEECTGKNHLRIIVLWRRYLISASISLLTSLRLHFISNMAVNNILCITLLVAIASVIFGVLNKEQPGPYMDEIFHIPQAQNYCIGNLSHWNPKITTLPGLYIVSLISLRILRFMPFVGRLFDQEQPCFTSFLRSINFFFMLVNFWLIFELTFMLHWNVSSKLSYPYLLFAFHLCNNQGIYLFTC